MIVLHYYPSFAFCSDGLVYRGRSCVNNELVVKSKWSGASVSALMFTCNLTVHLQANKYDLQRIKTAHVTRPAAEDAPAVSPTLTPQKPQPMSPILSTSTQQAEVAFFDKVKKYLSNKQIFAEFLKLCNLFSQDLIDKNVLVHKVSNFIGQNAELMDFFKRFVDYSGPNEVIENRPRAPTGKVSLSNCRGLGPSYRLLPKRVRILPSCSTDNPYCSIGSLIGIIASAHDGGT